MLLGALSKGNGIILVTGPTGSGKSSTLYSILKLLNKESLNVMTIEDPVEYSVDGINQINVNPKAGLNFATGLRAILRQDPDVIMIGEIRDKETAEIAVRAAVTGHLVLSTFHTNDVFTTITRLLEMKIEPYLLASAINLIISQRLVKKFALIVKKNISLQILK
uniref:GspE/PulE family protein n=1 Tax=Caloramator sp. Dgby_cultured_2 TaxID=3029174 RepID=UPI0031589EBC